MLDITKINFTHKKLVGKEHTWNKKDWFEEEDALLINTDAKDIWVDEIPITPDPSLPIITFFKDFELTENKTVQDRLSFNMINQNGERIKSLIPPSYGINYSAVIKVNGEKIPTSHPSQPLFDYTNGVLSFENTPPNGTISIDVYQYIGRTLKHFIDNEGASIAKGVLGLDQPQKKYIIQHNMQSYEIDIILYVFDEVDGINYWKKDVVPTILFDENTVHLELSETKPIRFIIKSYVLPSIE